jgi:hypothetical protein
LPVPIKSVVESHSRSFVSTWLIYRIWLPLGGMVDSQSIGTWVISILKLSVDQQQ